MALPMALPMALQIHSGDAQKKANARENLERLSKLVPYRTGALRALLNDAVERNDLSAADNYAQQLQMSQEVTFSDYLLCLNFYQKLDEKKFRLLLERVKPFAAKNPSDLASLMEWMSKNGLTAEVVKWIEKLPAKKLTSPPTAVAVANAYANAKNWSQLKRWTRKGMWGESDYLRLAYQAFATRQSRENPPDEFDKRWRDAEQSANGQPERELVLARLASKWSLEKESEQLWLRVAEDPPLRREALDGLRLLYRADNDTGKLYDVLSRLHESSPNEAPITADLARLGLNLERNVGRSHDLAKEARDRAPNEVVYYGQYGEDPYKINVTRMDSHGGWIATASNLVQLLDHLGHRQALSLRQACRQRHVHHLLELMRDLVNLDQCPSVVLGGPSQLVARRGRDPLSQLLA
jgi:hypothetical protein